VQAGVREYIAMKKEPSQSGDFCKRDIEEKKTGHSPFTSRRDNNYVHAFTLNKEDQ
jgi:hypothetical protein